MQPHTHSSSGISRPKKRDPKNVADPPVPPHKLETQKKTRSKAASQAWKTCCMKESTCQGASETGNISHPSAHRTPTDLQNRHSRGWVPAECLEQKMRYAYATVCTQGDFTLSRK